MLQILHTKSSPSNFVFVSRTDTSTRCANFFYTALLSGCLTSYVQSCMKRKNQRASFTDAKTRTHFHTGSFKAFDLSNNFAADSTTPLPM